VKYFQPIERRLYNIEEFRIDPEKVKYFTTVKHQSDDEYTLLRVNSSLSELFEDHNTKITSLTKNNCDNPIILNKPLSVDNIDWKRVLKYNMLGEYTPDFVHNMYVQQGWSNPHIQKFTRKIYNTDKYPICTLENEIHENLLKYMKDWIFTEKNFESLFVTGPKLLYDFDTNDQSLNNYISIVDIDNTAHCINQILGKLDKRYRVSLHFNTYYDIFMKMDKYAINKFFKKFSHSEFINMCYIDVYSAERRYLLTLIEWILDIPRGKEYMRNRRICDKKDERKLDICEGNEYMRRIRGKKGGRMNNMNDHDLIELFPDKNALDIASRYFSNTRRQFFSDIHQWMHNDANKE
jgi:hypothetical protein